MTATQASIIHCEYPLPHQPDPASLPAMLWSTNCGRLTAQTLFTLFFAGRDFAPKCVIDGVNIQDYLEHHYFTAFGHLADCIRDAGDLLDVCVIGWDSINEPFEGFCGNPDLANQETTHNASLKKGSHPTVIQSLRLGMGQKQTVENWKFTMFGPQRDGDVTIDPKGRRIWLDPEAEKGGVNARWGWKRGPEWKLGTCVWALHGVWDVETGELADTQYFASSPSDPSRPVVFIADYWKVHWQQFVKLIRASHPEAIHFVQPPVFVQPPSLDESDLRGRACYSGHYYDGLTLVTRHWNWFNADALGLLRGKYKFMWQAVKIGEDTIRKSLQEQLGMLKQDTEIIGSYPTLIGEIGTPFDMDGKRSYGYTDDGKYLGDYTNQQKALDASLNAADGPNCINWTVWTYCPESSHEWGDGWNMEDLSLWSGDDLRQNAQYAAPSAFSSAATLLKQDVPHSVARVVHSTSTFSLMTLGQTREPGIHQREKITSLSSWDNPLDFLTDGARAVSAFSRPYPTATVGVPIDMQFDISKAQFKLTVRVSPEDQLVKRHGFHVQDELTSERTMLPTEIFLPLVHFASQGLVASSLRRQANARGESEDQLCNGDDQTASLTSSISTLISQSSIDVDVEVSSGRWEIDCQTLKWWYDIPADGEVEYSITVSRTDGPIKKAEELSENCCEKLCSSTQQCSLQ
jgi:Glycoside hydrolase family 5 C-terminal domain